MDLKTQHGFQNGVNDLLFLLEKNWVDKWEGGSVLQLQG